MLNFNIFEKLNIHFNVKGGGSWITILKIIFRIFIVVGVVLLINGIKEGWENSLSFWIGFSITPIGLFFNWLIH
jgi:hypothetical protein